VACRDALLSFGVSGLPQRRLSKAGITSLRTDRHEIGRGLTLERRCSVNSEKAVRDCESSSMEHRDALASCGPLNRRLADRYYSWPLGGGALRAVRDYILAARVAMFPKTSTPHKKGLCTNTISSVRGSASFDSCEWLDCFSVRVVF
jgi:hypothetical protein